MFAGCGTTRSKQARRGYEGAQRMNLLECQGPEAADLRPPRGRMEHDTI